ncbi:unnamed protein product [Musa acuminata subsp. malaccensis]|uniref:(wild Malaysian banana) hypothetical protein n=1 Tax=Musa acuminata subsp. malaccensis TaxID=214687 RepID=A0A804JG65_MUSAM|nr:unnamed protein product [Musa acuminata subsp. malaccensis]
MRRTFVCIRLILHVMNKTSRLPLNIDDILSDFFGSFIVRWIAAVV